MLFLLPTFLSDNSNTLPEEVLKLIRSLDEFIVEDEKSARKFLKLIGSPIPQSKFIFHLLNEHTSDVEISNLLSVIKQKKDIGLMSEAGCPGVADPGAVVVRLAHENDILVKPFTGPSSILLALMSSGLNGQSFVFHGYLPRESAQRKIKIKQLEKDALSKNQTQIFIETPYRNNQMLKDLIETCSDDILLCLASNLTSSNEIIMTKKVAIWKKRFPALEKVPMVFLLGKK